MQKIKLRLFIAPLALGGLTFLALGGATLAQKPADKVATAPAKPPEKPRKITEAGDVRISSVNADHDGEKQVSRLSGNVQVSQDGEDFKLYADQAIYDHRGNKATASGSLRVETRDSTITGTNLRADFDTKHIYITGKVVMRSHGKDDGLKSDSKGKRPGDGITDIAHKPSNMWCDSIDFDYDIREALVTGNIRVKQGESNGTCKQIIFDEEANRAELKDNVVFTDKDGQTFKCGLLRVWFDDNRLKAFPPFELLSPRSKKEDKDKPTAPKTRHEFGDKPEVPALDDGKAGNEKPDAAKTDTGKTDDAKPEAPKTEKSDTPEKTPAKADKGQGA